MSIMSAFVIFCMIWTVVFFITLPFGVTSQEESGEIVPGTPASAPTDARIKRKALIATCITIALYAVIFPVLYWHLVSLDDINITFLTPPIAR